MQRGAVNHRGYEVAGADVVEQFRIRRQPVPLQVVGCRAGSPTSVGWSAAIRGPDSSTASKSTAMRTPGSGSQAQISAPRSRARRW
jgi:hypothetical protein